MKTLAADYSDPGGLVSVYLQKSRLFGRRPYGVYATADRIVGIKLGWGYLLFADAPYLFAASAYLAILYSARGFPSVLSIWYLILMTLPPTSILTGIITSSIVERMLKLRRQLTLEEVEKRKYFEVRRDQISQISIKYNTIFRPGSLTITPKLGKPVKVFIFGLAGTDTRCVYELTHLLESFTHKPCSVLDDSKLNWAI